MSTSTGMSKPMGIQKREYHEAQQLKAEVDFKYQTNQRIQNLQFAMDSLSKSLEESIADQGSLEVSCNTQISEVMNATMSSLKEFRQELGNIFTELENNKLWMKQVRAEIEDCVRISAFNEKIAHLHECIKILRMEKDSMRKEFNSLMDRLKLDFESKIKAQKEEILAIPSEIPDLRKLMDQKIELVELNGQNAVLRSSNNERQIMFVERKIENIYQLLKQLDINKQESK